MDVTDGGSNIIEENFVENGIVIEVRVFERFGI